MHKEDISSLPVPGLLASGGLLAIWVTNKRQLVQWVIQELLPLWGVVYIGEWIWIKVWYQLLRDEILAGNLYWLIDRWDKKYLFSV